MLSTICSIQTFGRLESLKPPVVRQNKVIRPMLTAPLIQRRLISFDNLGQTLEKASTKKVDGISTDAIFANRILTYANDGHLTLDFMGRVAHQELIEHEINREHHRRRCLQFAPYTAISGIAAIVSLAFGIALHHPPDWVIVTMVATSASALYCSWVVDNSDEKFEAHRAAAYRLYNEICLKYQTAWSPSGKLLVEEKKD
jgi:hypothetical protein